MSSARRYSLITAGAAFLAVLVLGVALLVILRAPVPDTAGTVQLPGASGRVEVVRDPHGVPHVFADDPGGLFFAQGYVTAQDRFFQLDVQRHIATGRYAELVGDRDGAIESDTLVRTLGWEQSARAELPLLSARTRNHLQAYTDGVNAYLSGRGPGEVSAAYVLPGARVRSRLDPWTNLDTLVWLKSVHWQQRTGVDSELGRVLALDAVGSADLVAELFPSASGPAAVPDPTPATAPDPPRTGAMVPAEPDPQEPGAERPPLAPLAIRPGWTGGTAVAVAGAHTASGQALLAADTEGVADLPGAWYPIGLHCRTLSAQCPFDVSGLSLPGVPGVVTGQNQAIAWAASPVPVDDADFVLEDVQAGLARVEGGSEPVQTRRERIQVDGGADVTVQVRATRHGPIVTDVLPAAEQVGQLAPVPAGSPARGAGYQVALQWAGSEPGRTLEGLLDLNAATGWEEFTAALSRYDGPAQTFVYADRAGHIGWQTAGRVPARPAGSSGDWPRFGWQDGTNWTGTVPPDQLPGERDPAAGFVVAADGSATPQLAGGADPALRTGRLTSLLQERVAAGDLDAEALRALQVDILDPYAQILVPVLVQAPRSDLQTANERAFTSQAVELLADWDLRQDPDSAAAAYFNAIWVELLRGTFHDQLPAQARPHGREQSARAMLTLMENPTSAWWDDVSTPTIVETRDHVVAQAVVAARLDLTVRLGKHPGSWQWGALHQVRLTDPRVAPGTGAGGALARRLFSDGDIPLPGSNDTVRRSGWDAAAGFTPTRVQNSRVVMDLGDPDGSSWVVQSGNSAHPLSGRFADQTSAWASGDALAWPVTAEAVQEAGVDRLIIEPEAETQPLPGAG